MQEMCTAKNVGSASASGSLAALAGRFDDLTTELSELLTKLSAEMHRAAQKPAASDLDNAFGTWKAAHDVWLATAANGGIPTDTPESEAEEAALLALASCPCHSLADIQSKASIFLTSRYLSESASDFTLNLLRSFVGGAVNHG